MGYGHLVPGVPSNVCVNCYWPTIRVNVDWILCHNQMGVVESIAFEKVIPNVSFVSVYCGRYNKVNQCTIEV